MNQEDMDKVKKAQEGVPLLDSEGAKVVEVLTNIKPFLSKESLELCEKMIDEFVRIINKERGRLIDELKTLGDEGIPGITT